MRVLATPLVGDGHSMLVLKPRSQHRRCSFIRSVGRACGNLATRAEFATHIGGRQTASSVAAAAAAGRRAVLPRKGDRETLGALGTRRPRSAHLVVITPRHRGWHIAARAPEQLVPRLRALRWGPDDPIADALKGNGLVRSTSPFAERIPERGVTWLEPKLVAEVSYAEIMHGGALRAAVFRGFV